MKKLLLTFYGVVLIVMLYGTVEASLYQNIFLAIDELGSHPWFQVTIYDTYFAFLTIAFWVFYKETSWVSRLSWFIAIMLLGNFAIAAYMILQLIRLKSDESVERIFTK